MARSPGPAFASTLALALALSIDASAHPHLPKPVPEEPSYAPLMLATDGIAVAAWVGGAFLESNPLAIVGAAGNIVSGPVVHLVNRRRRRAAASLGLRVGLPLIGFITATAATCDGSGCFGLGDGPSRTGAAAAAFGMAAAIFFDAALMTSIEEPGRRNEAPTIVPVAGVGPNGDVAIGLSGRF